MTDKIHTQVLIVGGGICGLWLLNSLRGSGYGAVLLEQDTLGSAQTLASQGMIHGGIKYALGGFTTPSSETIAGMPARWRACLKGEGSLNLAGTPILSDDYYLFSDQSLTSRVTAFFGSRSLRGRVEPLDHADFPDPFSRQSFRGLLYRLQDIVLDTNALLDVMATSAAGSIYQASPIVETDATGHVTGLRVAENLQLTADVYIFAAGAGNEALLAETCLKQTRMQRRPLRQVMVKHQDLPITYAHAVSANAGAKPRVTITTHFTRDGSRVWYLGGNLAETGVTRTPETQVDFAKQEMMSLFPDLPWREAQWRVLDIDRAEPAQPKANRPDSPFVHREGNAVVCWPTKLTLAPLLGDEVMENLKDLSPVGRHCTALPLPAARVGLPPWDIAF